MFARSFTSVRVSACLGAAALMIAALPSPAFARVPARPALFAVPAASFPAGSSVVRAGIESNRQLVRDAAGSLGLPSADVGRRTGYYMDAVEGDAAGKHASTSYLVSIFGSPRLAQAAYADRWSMWFAANYYTTPPAPPVTLGDGGSEALVHSVDPSQPPRSELFFRRGAILIEVFQQTVDPTPTAAQLHSFYSIATQLDTLAGAHPLGK